MASFSESVDLSVIIIAFNEESNLPRCLRSLPAGTEIIVLDSGSSDRTASIAENFGAQVWQRAFTNFAEHKNAALSYAKRRWVLAIDADEELDVNLREAILRQITLNEADAYRLERRLYFMGRPLRFGKTRDWPIRLFLREKASYQGSIHEVLQVSGVTKKLRQGLLWHYSYADLSDYFVRFNRYTSAIAEKHILEGKQPHFLAHVVRPGLEFFVRYGLRLGFLDGYPGYTYALISSLYAYIKYAKILEKKFYHD